MLQILRNVLSLQLCFNLVAFIVKEIQECPPPSSDCSTVCICVLILFGGFFFPFKPAVLDGIRSGHSS